VEGRKITGTEELNTLAKFLARRDVESLESVSADLLILLGNSLPDTARVVASAWRLGAAPTILLSGGMGHATALLWDAVRSHPEFGAVSVEGRAEADIFRDILVDRLRVDPAAVLVENVSTNCGSNAWESKRVIASLPKAPQTIILVQDPAMQRRTHASFERVYRGEPKPTFVSFAPFVPGGDENLEGLWPVGRFEDLVLGEIPRLRDDADGYGPKGRDFIEHVEIPAEVLAAFELLSLKYRSDRSRLKS